jgi:hypothetical protein
MVVVCPNNHFAHPHHSRGFRLKDFPCPTCGARMRRAAAYTCSRCEKADEKAGYGYVRPGSFTCPNGHPLMKPKYGDLRNPEDMPFEERP